MRLLDRLSAHLPERLIYTRYLRIYRRLDDFTPHLKGLIEIPVTRHRRLSIWRGWPEKIHCRLEPGEPRVTIRFGVGPWRVYLRPIDRTGWQTYWAHR